MDVDEILQLAECYIHQLSQHEWLPDKIKTIINDPLLGRQVTPRQHNHQKLVKKPTDEFYQLYA